MDMRKNLHLFSFQSQFNKDLLQLLVDKVYTKLLKAVSLQGESYKVRLGFTSQYTLNCISLADIRVTGQT